MNEEQAKEYARTFKVWIFQNKTKCIVFAGIIVALDRIAMAVGF